MNLNREETIEKISQALRPIKDIYVYLFGSSARGDFRKNSDIDILILLPDYLSSRERVDLTSEICGLLLPIELETELEINPIILPNKIWNEHKTPFTLNVSNERIRI